MKPGRRTSRIQGLMALGIGKVLREIAARLKDTEPAIAFEIETIGKWVDGTDRRKPVAEPFLAPTKPLKDRKRRPYSDKTIIIIDALITKLNAGVDIGDACRALGVEVSRFSKYMDREGYAAIIHRNASAKGKRSLDTKVSKPASALKRASSPNQQLEGVRPKGW